MRINQWAILGAITALTTFGCGGGGSGGGKSVPYAIAEAGTVVVTVTNEFGAPATGVDVLLLSNVGIGWAETETADANGTLTFTNVPCCHIDAIVDVLDGFGRHYGTAQGTLSPGGRLDLAVAMEPINPYPPALGTASAAAVAADGHSLEFTLRIIYAPSDEAQQAYSSIRMLIADCAPDTGNDTPVHRADCVAGTAGFDSPYTVVEPLNPEVARLVGGTPTAFSAALLIDQSRNVIASDPNDARLFGARYFLRNMGANNRVALAGFASNDAVSGEQRLLPEEPITVLPNGNLEFTASDGKLLPSIESLATLEGGASPLYAAIDEVLDLTMGSASATGRKTLVVATAGPDDTCGSPTACHAAQLALIAKSRAADVAIVVVGIAGPARVFSEEGQRELTQLTESTGGAALWAEDPAQLGVLFRAVAAVTDGSVSTLAARFRIESSQDDAFESGKTVLGNATFQVCYEGCADFYVPFAVLIP